MREINRGFAFIFGVGTLFLLLRLFGIGWFASVRDYISVWISGGDTAVLMRYSPVVGEMSISPVQLFTELIIESVISFGAVWIMTIKGVWYILTVLFGYFGQIAEVMLAYLRTLRDKEGQTAEVNTKLEAITPAVDAVLSRQDEEEIVRDRQAKLLTALVRHVKDVKSQLTSINDRLHYADRQLEAIDQDVREIRDSAAASVIATQNRMSGVEAIVAGMRTQPAPVVVPETNKAEVPNVG